MEYLTKNTDFLFDESYHGEGSSSQSSKSTKEENVTFLESITSKFVTAAEVPPWDRLSTGCQSIDGILKGGIPFNGITEVYGCSGVGKTQIMLQLALMIQLPEIYDGKDRGAVYICTEDAFPARRFHQLADNFKRKYNLPESNFEDNLYIDHIADYEQLRRCLSVRLSNLLQLKNIGLIILDSIAGAFRSENTNVNYTRRGQDIARIADILHNLADKYNAAVICTNQVAQDIHSDLEEPCLGLAWSNNVTYRIKVTRFNNALYRKLQIIFASDLPDHSTNFMINEFGITDE